MKAFNHILCPYDFSEFAGKALEYAIRLTRCSGDRLTVMNIMVNPFLFEGGSPILGSNIQAVDLLDKLREDDKQKLDALKKDLAAKHPDLDIAFREEESNDIGEAILQAQKSIGADLVVMGSHGRKGLRRVLLGSVAEDVLRHVECPVLIVK